MAGWYLINNVRIGSVQHFAGSHFDDRSTNTPAITAAGGILAPDTNPDCAKAAKLVAKLRRGGAGLEEIQALMVGAIGASLYALPSGGGGANPVQKVRFDSSSPSQFVLQAVTSQSVLLYAAITITTAFDGPGASAQLGTSTNPSQVFSSTEVLLGKTVTYDSSHALDVLPADLFLLTLSLAGSTVGAGILVYEIG